MVSAPAPALHRFAPAALVLVALLAVAAPVHATVSTVYNCPSSGTSGNHDFLYDPFYIATLAAVNIHQVTLFYTADADGSYDLTLSATSGSYTGPEVGSPLSQTVTLTSGVDTAVTWNFNDAAFTSGNSIYFQPNGNGPGSIQYEITNPSGCPNDIETVGASTNDNGYAVPVNITQNTGSSGGGSGCVANATTLCIDNNTGDKRFQITAAYSTSQDGGRSGNGGAISLAPVNVTQGGIFWFFASTNPEMLIKVLNGCAVDDKFWVFYAAMTNVGFTVTVKDTKTNAIKTYKNTDLTAAPPVQDTAAFPCP